MPTSDSSDFVGSPAVIDPSTPNPVTTFEANCFVGTTGSPTEQGLVNGNDAVVKAESGIAPNTGFWREDAGLRIIYVSDEPDYSPGYGTPNYWLDYVDDLRAMKSTPNHVVLSAITGTDGYVATSCSGGGGSASPGTGYVEVVNETGGVLDSICDFDWTGVMEDLGYVAEHLSDTFVLTQVPDPSTLNVFVNGVLQSSGWSFDSGINAIVFDAAAVPADGDLVEIDYCT